MACYTRAKASAQLHQQTLFFCQAADQSEQVDSLHRQLYKEMLAVASVNQTGKLPGFVLLHIGMRVRITTQVLPPWAVQDTTGRVMEIDACPQDQHLLSNRGDAHLPAELRLAQLPRGVYVKLDECDREFLPPLVCPEHQQAGFCKRCKACRAFEGWVLIKPLKRPWTFTDKNSGVTLHVKRSQLPLMPADACSLYALQGATCDPGLIAHFTMPPRGDNDIKWLIVYVLLSRVRSLSNLRSVGLNTKIRAIIEGGPPTMIAENFEKLFRKKIIATHEAAAAAKAALAWD